jgi:hypothetical protein
MSNETGLCLHSMPGWQSQCMHIPDMASTAMVVDFRRSK